MGLAFSFISHNYLGGKPKWTTDHVPDLAGMVAIVTGGNLGWFKENI